MCVGVFVVDFKNSSTEYSWLLLDRGFDSTIYVEDLYIGEKKLLKKKATILDVRVAFDVFVMQECQTPLSSLE